MSFSPALASYLPRALLARLAEPAPLTAPEMHHAAGAMLISDVESFTPLVEAFALRGREGLEELTWTLNKYVSDLVEIVHAAGGDVLSIAGDALLCYWPAESDAQADVATATMKATRAGFAIQRLLNSASGNRFDTRIGIGAGSVALAFVGGELDRWELVAGGAAFHDAAAAERAATTSGVVLAIDAWSLVKDQCSGAQTDGAFVTVADPGPAESTYRTSEFGVDVDVLRPFLPLPVRERIAKGTEGLDWLAETRLVSVLMTELPALRAGNSRELATTHDAVRAFQGVVERCEGSSRVDIDQKGALLLAAFGVPPRAHENDAERAAHAATLLAAEFARLGVRAGIGVATGRAFCGAFGSTSRKDYMIRGDVINLAARLMHAAEGGICCDAETVGATRGRMEFERLSDVTVKGRSGPMEIHRPLARRGAAASHEGDVIGRETERREIGASIETLTRGSSGVMILEGEAGLGKSRLLDHASMTAEAAGVRVLHAAADAIERTTPNYAWRQIFASMFGIAGMTDQDIMRTRVEEHMRRLPSWQRMTPLLSDILPVRLEENELTQSMSADVRADNSKLLLTALLRDSLDGLPAMLAIEDAHWLDSGSWALLLAVIHGVQPLLVVVTTRPVSEPHTADTATLIAAAGSSRFRLESLSAAEMKALIARTLGVTEIPDDLSRFIFDRVNGHPFFCEELVRAMRDVGAVHVEHGRPVIGNLNSLDLPTTVEGVIVSRLDRLTPAQQSCLKVAAVIGRVFRARLVEDTHPEPGTREHVREHLREVAALDLTTLESMEPELAYLFKHVITRDVTYDMMPIAQRQPLHRAVAEWHEHTYSADLSPHFGLLAYHWLRAADQVRAVDFFEKAGELAARTGAFQEALQLLGQAVQLMDSAAVPLDEKRRALWKQRMGSASYFLYDFPGSLGHLAEAIAYLDRPLPASRGAVIAAGLKELGRQVLHRLAPKRYSGRRFASKALLDETVDAYVSLVKTHYLQGAGPEWLLYLVASGLNIGDEAGDSAPLAHITIQASIMAYLLGLRGSSDHYSKRALAMVEREPSAAGFVWHNYALLLAQRAAWREFRAASDRALALLQEVGDTGLESEAWQVRSTALHCQGDFVSATHAWTRMREVAEHMRSPGMLAWSFLDEIETRLATGDLDAALRALDEAVKVPTPDSDLGLRLEKLRGIASTRLRQGGEHLVEAISAADEIYDILQTVPPTGLYMADHFAAALEVYVAALDSDASTGHHAIQRIADRAKKGIAQLAKFGKLFVNVQPRALFLRGVLAAQQGDLKKARKLFEKAAARAHALDMPLDEGRALLALRDESVVARANELFARAGATYYLQRR